MFHKCLNSCRLILPFPSSCVIRIKKDLHAVLYICYEIKATVHGGVVTFIIWKLSESKYINITDIYFPSCYAVKFPSLCFWKSIKAAFIWSRSTVKAVIFWNVIYSCNVKRNFQHYYLSLDSQKYVLLLSMLKTVMLLNISVESMMDFFLSKDSLMNRKFKWKNKNLIKTNEY